MISRPEQGPPRAIGAESGAPRYSDVELDALREVANLGSSTAATALASLLGMPVDVSTPLALALPLTEAIDYAASEPRSGAIVVVAVSGDLEALVVMIMQPPTEVVVCDLLGVEAGTELGLSALGELGNILGASYLGGLATLTGLALESSPPEIFIDTLAAALTRAGLRGEETVILLESTLAVDGNAECSPMLLFAPGEQGADEILGRLGVSRET